MYLYSGDCLGFQWLAWQWVGWLAGLLTVTGSVCLLLRQVPLTEESEKKRRKTVANILWSRLYRITVCIFNYIDWRSTYIVPPCTTIASSLSEHQAEGEKMGNSVNWFDRISLSLVVYSATSSSLLLAYRN